MSEWIKTAKIGDKVVCIDRDWVNVYGLPSPSPEFGAVFTIADIVAVKHEVYLFFVEIEGGWGYEAIGFRPVEPRKTDIRVFTDMLKTVGKPVTEDA